MKVKFFPLGKEFEAGSDESVLDIAKEHGIQIKSVCGGLPSCAECRVQIKDGEFNVFPPSEEEVALIGTAHFVDRSRLSCQLKCFGDITIDLTEQIEKASRGTSTKKPRGKHVDTTQKESFAVEGSIILDGKELDIFGSNLQKNPDKLEAMVQDERLEDAETARIALERIKRRHQPNTKADDDSE
jgi:2Fe-2S ferredoxin